MKQNYVLCMHTHCVKKQYLRSWWTSLIGANVKTENAEMLGFFSFKVIVDSLQHLLTQVLQISKQKLSYDASYRNTKTLVTLHHWLVTIGYMI